MLLYSSSITIMRSANRNQRYSGYIFLLNWYELIHLCIFNKTGAQRDPAEKPSEIRLDQDGIQKED
jgi:hypothetical protein